MTPEQLKAKELIEQFESEVYDVDAVDGGGWDNCRLLDKSVQKVAKRCAIIHCQQMIETFDKYTGMHDQEFLDADKYFFKRVIVEINNYKH